MKILKQLASKIYRSVKYICVLSSGHAAFLSTGDDQSKSVDHFPRPADNKLVGSLRNNPILWKCVAISNKLGPNKEIINLFLGKFGSNPTLFAKKSCASEFIPTHRANGNALQMHISPLD